MPENEKVPSLITSAEILEVSGWLMAEVRRHRDMVQNWAHSGRDADKHYCFEFIDGLSNIEKIIRSLLDENTRLFVREEVRKRNEEPF